MVEAAAPLANADFEYIRTLVKRLAAMELEDDKHYLVQARLAPVAADSGCRDLAELARRIRLEESGPLAGKIIDALTTNETLFFRDGHPFQALRKTVIPELMQKRKDSRKLAVWSAASSTGQEAYSFSMLVREHFPELIESWKVEILGTDISAYALSQAREARYSRIAINRGLPAQLMVRYFRHENDSWTIREDVRKMVEFRHLNLDGHWPYLPIFDLVFIRNVLIYMSLETRRKILARIRRQIAPDGYLLLGATENMLQTPEGFTSVDIGGSLFYRPIP
jgi:chemotaxis protein methyltransferase CheR